MSQIPDFIANTPILAHINGATTLNCNSFLILKLSDI